MTVVSYTARAYIVACSDLYSRAAGAVEYFDTYRSNPEMAEDAQQFQSNFARVAEYAGLEQRAAQVLKPSDTVSDGAAESLEYQQQYFDRLVRRAAEHDFELPASVTEDLA